MERLQAISESCRDGRPLDEELARWFGRCLARFLERGAASFDEAFGLPSNRGGVPLWKQMRIRDRDEALRALATTIEEDASLSARVRTIQQMTLRYGASAWRHDAARRRMPDSYAGTPRELLWRAFRAGAAMPLGERRLRTILSAGS